MEETNTVTQEKGGRWITCPNSQYSQNSENYRDYFIPVGFLSVNPMYTLLSHEAMGEEL